MNKFLTLIFVAFTLSGCDRKHDESSIKVDYEWRYNGHNNYLIERTLSDGNRCVIVASELGARGVTCDWGKK